MPATPQQLGTLFRVLHVTPWELMPFVDDYEPPYPAWRAFLDTPEGASMTLEQRKSLAWHPFVGTVPTVATYQLLLAAERTAAPA